MNLKSIIPMAGVALLSLIPVSPAKAQGCGFIGVYEIYSGCYLRVTTCGASTIGTGCGSGGKTADKPKKTSSKLVTPKPQRQDAAVSRCAPDGQQVSTKATE